MFLNLRKFVRRPSLVQLPKRLACHS